MRLAVFGDIHANLEAMQAVAEDFKWQQVDHSICLGDLIGYGPNPNECIDLIRSMHNITVVQGNHDAAVTGLPRDGLSMGAQQAILWSMSRLRKDNIGYLAQLDTTWTMDEMIFSHASPFYPKSWQYLNSRLSASRAFKATSARLLFVGHTHKPLVITKHNPLRMSFTKPEPSLVIKIDGPRRIINCGSVGQPRDGNPMASYLLCDVGRQEITFRRVHYDHAQTAAKIMSAGLPAFQAKRLAIGK